jgi:hypothetical protein
MNRINEDKMVRARFQLIISVTSEL